MAEPTPKALPGFEAAAVGFDQPFEMLSACHERTRRSLRLLTRLAGYLSDHGVDEKARQAATDVLRYFVVAAPQHHKDEELHIVPLLQASGDKRLATVGKRMLTDHREIAESWLVLAPLLDAVVHSALPAPAALATAADDFVLLHQEHLTLEENFAFPAAMAFQAHLGATDLSNIGEEMAGRRLHSR